MTMRGTARITNPDTAIVELTVSMSVKEWRELMKMQPVAWPACDLRNLIGDMLNKTVERVEMAHEIS